VIREIRADKNRARIIELFHHHLKRLRIKGKKRESYKKKGTEEGRNEIISDASEKEIGEPEFRQEGGDRWGGRLLIHQHLGRKKRMSSRGEKLSKGDKRMPVQPYSCGERGSDGRNSLFLLKGGDATNQEDKGASVRGKLVKRLSSRAEEGLENNFFGTEGREIFGRRGGADKSCTHLKGQYQRGEGKSQEGKLAHRRY